MTQLLAHLEAGPQPELRRPGGGRGQHGLPGRAEQQQVTHLPHSLFVNTLTVNFKLK
jgi:hypothetical protein